MMSGTKRPGGFLEFFSGAKHRNSVGTYRDDLSGFRITRAVAPLACTNLERSESTELDNLVLTQAFLHLLEELVENMVDILAIDTRPLMDVLDYLGLRQFVARQNQPSVSGSAATATVS
jgi:hypothetical protein